MFSIHILLVCLLVLLFFCSHLQSFRNDSSSPLSDEAQRVLSRKRRFLLFPPGANFIVRSESFLRCYMLIIMFNVVFVFHSQVTISGGKGSMFETPRGYNLVAEMDMYHPLPDYMYHATSLRLGEIAMYPSETSTVKPATSPTNPHYEHELSQHELDDYLARHPDTWVPTNWANDRADWAPSSSSANVKYLHTGPQRNATSVIYQSWKRKLWESTGNDRLYYNSPPAKRVRSLTDFKGKGTESSFWTEANHLNISQHVGWEHFHHYRDRRSLFHHLETTIPSLYPLKSDLTDKYSKMIREEKPNCREMFSERCPLSLLQLILFGKFEL
uniref:Uncharacterized protein n=1 Tax=Anopheles dirus TaxID=7168 RepID=A0A182NDV3_9DIPT